MRRTFLHILTAAIVVTLGACAALPGREPIQVTVAGFDSLPGEGLEVRMLVKLRVQNPNDAPLEYDGVYVKVEVQDKTFATGVSDQRGTIPRFSEALIDVPVTVSAMRAAYHGLGIILGGTPTDKVRYKMSGKLSGPMFGSTSFDADGELSLPKP